MNCQHKRKSEIEYRYNHGDSFTIRESAIYKEECLDCGKVFRVYEYETIQKELDEDKYKCARRIEKGYRARNRYL